MENLPSDPYMLLSVVNMKLRDQYSSLEALCDDLDIAPEDIEEPLKKAGYVYDSMHNCFT